MLNDVRYSLRMMRRTPMFTAAVILTVALAIAANSAIFSVVNAVMLRPLPFRDPDRLVQVAEKNDKLNLPSFGASALNFLSWREQTHAFDELAAVGFSNYTLSGSGEPEQLSGNRISPALTRVLGLAPVAGRAFSDDEETPGVAPVAMIGEGLWKRRFGADSTLIGRTIVLNGAPTTVIGIAPAALNLISGGDIYTPLSIDRSKEIRLNHVIFVVGRLRQGVSLQQAQAEMDSIARHLGRQYPEVRDWGIHLITLFDTFVSPQLKTGLWVLLSAVILVLLIACANIANLLLARAATRQKEMAVRTALGANRTRLLRQLMVESIVLSIAGGGTGLVGAAWAVRAINRALPPNVLPVPAVPIDATVLWFAAALTLVTGLFFGIAPAWRASRVDINEVLKQAGRESSGGVGARLRQSLVTGEMALATVLLIGAGLLIQTLTNLERVHLGFDSHGLITFQLAPPPGKYPLNSKAPLLYRSLLDSLLSVPGVNGAAVSSGIPFGAGNYTTHPMLTTGQSALPPGTLVPIDWRIVSPGYFKTLDIPLVRGRDFTDADGPTALPVMVVSQATARRFWGDADPLGHTLTRSADPRTAFTIVGVVGDVRSTALNQESPALYYPMASRVWPLMDVVVRTGGSAETVLPAIRQKVHELDAELALANIRTMDQWLSNSAAQPRLNTVLLGAFASVALLIAAIGIYGVLAYSVSQRTREIGLRMALGATPRGVLSLIVREGMTLVLIGIGIGLAGGLALGRAVSSLVFGVTVRDPATFAVVTVVLATVALAACIVPARRAASVDPMIALREE
ncbi:MAG: ABC transporter permease [Acidobacteriia bacterium]|nr:ABC transporter permease [Terriglobia bacterium]